MRCASGMAFFNSLGLVSGGLRKQAATFFSHKRNDGRMEEWNGRRLESWSDGEIK
jgi:hypothetical protein